jgi:hypothetical protein
MNRDAISAFLVCIPAGAATPVLTQPLSGPAADPQFKFSTAMPSGVASPDRVETRLGTLNFFDGFPDKASAATLLDNLDFQRAVQAYLLALPAVNQAGDREAILTQGPANGTVPIWEQLVDSRTIELTASRWTRRPPASAARRRVCS